MWFLGSREAPLSGKTLLTGPFGAHNDTEEAVLASCVSGTFSCRVVSRLNRTNSLTADERQRRETVIRYFLPGYHFAKKLLSAFICKKSDSPLFWQGGNERAHFCCFCNQDFDSSCFLCHAWIICIAYLQHNFSSVYWKCILLQMHFWRLHRVAYFEAVKKCRSTCYCQITTFSVNDLFTCLANLSIETVLFQVNLVKICDREIVICNRSFRKSQRCCNGVSLLILSRCHPGTLGDEAVRLLQLQLGKGANQPQRHRAVQGRGRQAAPLFRHVEKRLRCRGGGKARLLAGRRQLLRQVRREQKINM